jgi:hypothetical protein
VIRNVVLVKLKAGVDAAEVAEIQDGFRNLACPGTVSYTLGDDLRLRDDTWSFAIVADFTGPTTWTPRTTGTGPGSARWPSRSPGSSSSCRLVSQPDRPRWRSIDR